MTDEEFIKRQFEKDCRDKKRVARGEANRVKSNRGAVKMPSDYLTEGERRKMSGECIQYSLDKPMPWDKFKKLDMDTQREYLDRIWEKYKAPNGAVADMLGTTATKVKLLYQNLGIEHVRGASRYWDSDGFNRWCGADKVFGGENEVLKKALFSPQEAVSLNGDEITQDKAEILVELIRAAEKAGLRFTLTIEG